MTKTWEEIPDNAIFWAVRSTNPFRTRRKYQKSDGELLVLECPNDQASFTSYGVSKNHEGTFDDYVEVSSLET